MPLRYVKQCNTCNLTQHDKELKKRILNSQHYSQYGHESLADIQRDYRSAFSYNALLRHCSKHWRLTDREREVRDIRKADPKPRLPASLTAQSAPLALADPGVNEDAVFDTVMKRGMERLENGELEINASHLLKAAKDKADLGLKRKDQQLKIQEMIWHFASGQAEGNKVYDGRLIEGEEATAYDAAAITSGNVDAGETRPSTVHQPATWDAIAQGAGEVSTPSPDGTDQAT